MAAGLSSREVEVVALEVVARRPKLKPGHARIWPENCFFKHGDVLLRFDERYREGACCTETVAIYDEADGREYARSDVCFRMEAPGWTYVWNDIYMVVDLPHDAVVSYYYAVRRTGKATVGIVTKFGPRIWPLREDGTVDWDHPIYHEETEEATDEEWKQYEFTPNVHLHKGRYAFGFWLYSEAGNIWTAWQHAAWHEYRYYEATLTIQADKTKVRVGEEVELSGRLTVKHSARGGVRVRVVGRDPEGNDVYVGDDETDSEGKYSVTFTPSREGTYRLWAECAVEDPVTVRSRTIELGPPRPVDWRPIALLGLAALGVGAAVYAARRPRVVEV